MSRLLNIHGPSGAGKTLLVREALAVNRFAIGAWFSQLYRLDGNLDRYSVSILPTPKFRGTVADYFRIFGITPDRICQSPPALCALFTTLGAVDALTSTPLDSLKDRTVESLSTGEQRRLMLARALLQPSQLVVVDEPFAGSDPATAELITDAILTAENLLVLTHLPLREAGDGHEFIWLSVDEARRNFRDWLRRGASSEVPM